MPNTLPTNREINRRALLTGTVATAAGLAASTLPAEPAPVESARDVIKRAGKEIAAALNHYDDGRWHALIYPSDQVKDGLWLGSRMRYEGLDLEPKLVALEQKWRKAKEAEERSAVARGKAEERYFAMRGNFDARPTPKHLMDAQMDITVREMLDKDHPTNVARSAFNQEESERRAEWQAERERLHMECGVDKAEARHDRAMDRVDRAFCALLDTPARTLEGVRLKVRVINEHCNHVPIEQDIWEAVAADIMRGLQGPEHLS